MNAEITSAEPAEAGHRNLVFARVGPNSLHKKWASVPYQLRSWDIQLSTYTESVKYTEREFPILLDKGTKWDSIVRYFEIHPSLLDKYDFVFFPDDDLDFCGTLVNKIFEICAKHDIYISQPGLTASSYCWHSLLLSCPLFELRYINYVEPMCPCIKSSYLKEILPFIKQHFTGWGIDNVWTMLMPNPAFRAAILDATPVHHTRPFQAGDIYKTFAEMNIDPVLERHSILRAYQSSIIGMVVYGGILPSGTIVKGIIARIMNGYFLLSNFYNTRNAINTLRAGIGSFVRVFTLASYKPERITPLLGVPEQPQRPMVNT